jgi:hypothetical protein
MPDAPMGAGRTCFVIGPIGSPLAPAGSEARLIYENSVKMWESVFEQAAQHFGMDVVRADRISAPGEIPEQIFTLLRDADVVIADVSGGNSNVMYELGLRHSRDAITIQIGEYERLPFDVNTIRTIQFRRTEAGLIDARNALIEMLESALRGEASPVPATRVWLAGGSTAALVESAVAASSIPPSDEVNNDSVEIGVVEMMADGEAAIQSLGEILADATTAMGEMSEAMATATEGNEESDRQGRGFAGRLNVARQLASDLDEPIGNYEATAERYLSAVALGDSSIKYMVSRVAEGHEPRADFDELFNDIIELAAVVHENSIILQDYRGGLRVTSRLASVLRPLMQRADHAVLRFLRANEMIEGWAEAIGELPDEQPDGTRLQEQQSR